MSKDKRRDNQTKAAKQDIKEAKRPSPGQSDKQARSAKADQKGSRAKAYEQRSSH
jgi:hypothetical protein